MTIARLETLKSKFAQFRAESRPHSRIPDSLRGEVLAAVAAGIEPAKVTAALKVGRSQIEIWQQRLTQPNAKIARNPLRVLDLVSALPPSSSPTDLRVSYEGGRLVLELSCSR